MSIIPQGKSTNKTHIWKYNNTRQYIGANEYCEPLALRRFKGDRAVVESRSGFLEEQQRTVHTILFSVKTSCCVSFPQFVWPIWTPHLMILLGIKGEVRDLFEYKYIVCHVGQTFPLTYVKIKLMSIKNKL